MADIESQLDSIENLVEQLKGGKSNVTTDRRHSTKRGRRLAEPHLRAHISHGKIYYYYCRGADKEFYLGDADSILGAVRKNKDVQRF